MSRSTSRRRATVLGALALLVVGGAALLFLAVRPDGSAAPGGGAAGASGATEERGPDAPVQDEVLEPLTPTPTAPADNGAEVDPVPSEEPSGLRSVVVSHTYAGWDPGTQDIVVGGFVSDVVETGGTCTLTLTQDGVTTSGTADATPDASTTSCGEVRAGGGRLVSGSWEAVLSYTSPRSTGESAVFSVVVP
ncbi:hypothetical protein ACI799_20485 [Blastococcus sp. SYSU DS0753]